MKAFIVGASSDIGLAVCAKYLKMGWYVIAHYRSLREELLVLQTSYPKKIEFVKFDLSDLQKFRLHLVENQSIYSSCDAVINCVGIANPKCFEDISEHDVIEHIRINFLPNIILSQNFSKWMTKRGWGRFVYLSSIGVKFSGGIDNYCYSMSKLLTEFFPAVAKKNWAANNVFVNAVRIGVIDTKFHNQFSGKSLINRASLIPAKRLGNTSEVAEAIFFLGSDQNTFITCEVLTIAGGE
jgi:3-oxoacyl-[acyl-carrier protein] reductase